MTAPGDSVGEGAHRAPEGGAPPPPAGDRPPDQPVSDAPWASPAQWPAADYPPPAYQPPPAYPWGPPGFPPDYGGGYPPPIPPAGYPSPGYPPYGGYGPPAHPSGYPSGYYPPPDFLSGYRPANPGMNTLAVVSLVSACIGVFCCIGSIVAIVLGTIALNQVKQTREEGYGLAVAGIVIGVATLLVYLVVGIFAVPSR
ncbi:DUF4190 domain-containing protein [Mycobacterium shinjukuense]|uniref:Uncharacterized protein n=1 Tax=Mycobacterium shinjukuense TaxID=398694 RepID=A0A7I7MKZ6_9MYCO|nr:DUF4190 domain-containing protein [Mycobacterium shinjukuense]MCV6986797.1 DUF4190 domain-containing protein [Mycobacterium shinjukuense]ORB69599.1 hypothetical protein BST45_08880 [Mycobacterium shinjukuense]BBX72530.1 hypothetical protein MSHI_04360 [Mycobacterium shinjukuense]